MSTQPTVLATEAVHAADTLHAAEAAGSYGLPAGVRTRDVSLVLTAAVTAAVALLVSPGNMLMIAMLLYFAVLLARFYLPGLDRALQLRWRTGDERQEV